MNSTPSPSQPPSHAARLGRIGWVALVFIAIGLLIGLLPRWLAHRRLIQTTNAESAVTVAVVTPMPSQPGWSTPLPADVQAFVQAPIYARASGYLKDWFVDIGAHVTNGQMLAEIDTPDLDEQLAQARAQLDQTLATLELAKTTAARWTDLLKTASVSEQETAQKISDYALQKANVEAARANVRRLEDLKNFAKVTAPFAGTITLRNTDIGQLITAGSGQPLFTLAQTNPLRVYVRVPETMSGDIAIGEKADMTLQEIPGREFKADVIRTADAVDPASRTLLVELQVPNPRGEILAGSYAQVRFNETSAPDVLTLPDNALVFGPQGMQVAIVGSDGTVHLQSVKLGRDNGTTVEILSGITTNDQVIVNLPDSISNGMKVQVAQPTTTSAAK